MGYTHYFKYNRTFTAPEWKRVCSAAVDIIQWCQGQGIRLLDVCDTDAPPTVDAGLVNRIRFNGSDLDGEDLGHETFVLERYGTGRDFVKTARKPYDLAVALVLLACYDKAAGALAIGSDGEWNEDNREKNYGGGWVEARFVYRGLFGREPDCPWS